MSSVSLGKKVPDFRLPATSDQEIHLADLKGSQLVLYFYPKDNTPGCTLEGQDFRDQHAKFKRQNTIILGVSRDSLAAHAKFKDQQNFPFELLSDGDETLCRLFDVIKEKICTAKRLWVSNAAPFCSMRPACCVASGARSKYPDTSTQC